MCIQLAFLGPGTCFNITPHFSNSRKTKLVSPGENLHGNIWDKQYRQEQFQREREDIYIAEMGSTKSIFSGDQIMKINFINNDLYYHGIPNFTFFQRKKKYKDT